VRGKNSFLLAEVRHLGAYLVSEALNNFSRVSWYTKDELIFRTGYAVYFKSVSPCPTNI